MGKHKGQHSATGTRTRIARVRAEYPNQLDYSGFCLSHRQSIKRGRMWNTQAFQAQHLCRRQEQQPCCGGRLGLLRQQRPYRLVVRTSHRGRDNPGSTPGGDICWVTCCGSPVSKSNSNLSSGERRSGTVIHYVCSKQRSWADGEDHRHAKNLVHFLLCACHPCAGAMLIFSVSFQFYRMIPEGNPIARYGKVCRTRGIQKTWYTSRFVRVILAQGPC